MDRRVVFLGKGKQLDAALGEQGLVAGDHRFFCAQRGGDNFKRISRAADQLDDDVHRRILHQLAPVGGKHFRRHFASGRARLGGVAHEYLGNVQTHATTGAAGDQLTIALKHIPHAGTDSSESGQTNAK